MIRSSQALPALLALAVAACGGQSAPPAGTPAPAKGEVILDARTGAPVTRDALVKRLKGADRGRARKRLMSVRALEDVGGWLQGQMTTEPAAS